MEPNRRAGREAAGVLPPLGLAGVGLGGLPGRSSRLAGDGGITSVCGAPCPPAGAVPAAPGRPGVRASGPSPAAALPARRSRPRRLAGGGGPGCGGLGSPAALVRASGGRLAYRRGVPAHPGGAASPPGAAAAASVGPVPGGLSSPGPRSPGRLVVAAGLRPPGPPCEGAARPASARPPRPVRPAPGPPRPPPIGPPTSGTGGRLGSLPRALVRRPPAAALVSLSARGRGGLCSCLGAAAALVGPAALLRGRWGMKPDGRVCGQGSRRAAASGRP